MAMIRTPSEAATAVTKPPVGPILADRAGQNQSPGVRGLIRMATAIRSNRKATWGFVLLVLFIAISAFPGLIAHKNPSAMVYPVSLGPSVHHLLGTTGLGQDMFAQVIWGARPVLLIAFGVGLAATGIAVLIGVAAAYLGGAWDAVLNLLADHHRRVPAQRRHTRDDRGDHLHRLVLHRQAAQIPGALAAEQGLP
jgi:peptide/nickel transport system permease protein